MDEQIKVYKYKTGKVLLSSLGPVLLMTFLLVASIFAYLENRQNLIYQSLVVVLPVLLLFEVFALNQPTKIMDDQEKISFHAFGQSHVFKWAELNYLRIRKFPLTTKILLRIGPNRFLRGRYWLFPKELSNGDELMAKLTQWEQKLHPEKEQHSLPKKVEQKRKTAN